MLEIKKSQNRKSTQEPSVPGSQNIAKKSSAGISIDLSSRGNIGGSLFPNSESGRDPS